MISAIWTVCCRETMVLIQIFFSDQIMFWSFEFFGHYWLLFMLLSTNINDFSNLNRLSLRITLLHSVFFFCDHKSLLWCEFSYFLVGTGYCTIYQLRNLVISTFEPFTGIIEDHSFAFGVFRVFIMMWTLVFSDRDWLL